MPKLVLRILILAFSHFWLVGCTGLKVQAPDTATSVPTVRSEKRVYNINIPEEMPLCNPGVISTSTSPCYEGKYVIDPDTGTEILQETCGKYWDLYPNDEQQAIMERVDCCKRNNQTLIYYLNINRGQLKHLQGLLRDGI